MEIALGKLNMTEDEFWDITPRVFQLKCDGFFSLVDNVERLKWERMRFQTVALINSQRKRSEQITAQKLIKFDWEKTETQENERNKIDYILHKAKNKK